MTVKELADELGVSKPTVAKAISDCGIEPRKVGNRFDLSDEECNTVKMQILQTGEPPKIEKSQETQNTEPQKPQNETEKSLISLLKTQISLLQEQLSVKDTQLAEKDRQLADLTSALKSSQEQAATLTTALNAAQALHAATVQERLEERAGAAGEVSEVTTESAPEPQEQSRGFFARIFRKKG